MKKMLGILCLTLCLIIHAASAESSMLLRAGQDSLPENMDIHCATAFSDTVCVCDTGNYCYYLIAQDSQVKTLPSLTVLESDDVHERYRSAFALVNDNENVYGIEMTICTSNTSGTFENAGLYKLDFDGKTSVMQAELDISDAIRQDEYGEYCLSFVNAAMNEKWLCMLFRNDEEGSSLEFGDANAEKRLLICFDLINHKKYTYDVFGALELLTVTSDTVLYAQTVSQTECGIIQFDALTGAAESICTISDDTGRCAEHFDYDPAEGTIYYSIGNRIQKRAVDASVSENVCILPIRYPQGIHFLSENRIFAWDSEAAAILKGDPSQEGEARKLVVRGSNQYTTEFALDHPEVEIIEYNGTHSIIDAIQTHSEVPDVIIANTYNNPEVKILMDRGYLFEMDSPIVRETISQMYPAISQQVTLEDSIIAMPYALLQQPMFGINLSLWREMELGNPPQTWSDMADFLNRWPELARKFPDVRLITGINDNQALRSLVFSRIQFDYEQYRTTCGEKMGYDTEQFRSLLSIFNSVDFDAISMGPDDPSRENTLLIANYTPTAQHLNTHEQGLPLSVAEGVPSNLTASLYVMLINPYSQNKDAAMQLMEYTAQNLEPVTRIEMMPNENEPIRQEGYEEYMAEQLEKIESLNLQLESTEEEVDRKWIEDQLSQTQDFVQSLQKDAWIVSEASIANYRNALQNMYILYNNGSRGSERKVREQYLLHQISEDQYISELERRYVMQERENS